MKRVITLITAMLILLSAAGCDNRKTISFDGKEVSQVNISKFKKFASINPEGSLVFSNNKEIETFIHAVEKAKKMPGILNVAPAQYDLNILFKDNSSKGCHLWLHEQSQSGFIIWAEDTHFGYEFSKEAVIQLTALIKNREKTSMDTIREIAYNSIAEEDKRAILDWENAKVQEYTAEKDHTISSKAGGINIKGKKTYRVSFETQNKILGDIIVYVDQESKNVLGIDGRD